MLGKKELFQIRCGVAACARFIEVDRSNHARAVRSIEYRTRSSCAMAEHLSRSEERDRACKIGPLKRRLSSRWRHAPIVPVAIRGTIDILPRGGRVMRTHQPVHVTIGAPIPVDGRDLPSLMAEVDGFLKQHVEGS
jgi:1-acyl-sn-glycerol-3-phosphate acyltransferase